MCRGYRCAETIYRCAKTILRCAETIYRCAKIIYRCAEASSVQRLYTGAQRLYTGAQRLYTDAQIPYTSVQIPYTGVQRPHTSVHAGAEARGSSLTQSQTIICLVRKSNWCLAAAETVVRGRGASTARVHYLYITCHRYFTCQQRQPGLAFCTSAAAASVNLVSLKAAVRWLCCNRKRFVYLSRWI